MGEVLDSAIQIEHEGFNLNIPPLVGILILKLVSWSIKPERKKDLDDIFEIIKDYFEFSKNDFYENHIDLVDELNTDTFILEAGSFMIGIEMAKIFKENGFLQNKIIDIINAELSEKPGSISLYFLLKEYFKDRKIVKRVFTLINKGLTR